jgi:purine-binding chemotaxis protein CheW
VSESFILFKIAETTYAIPALQIQQVELVETVTRVPESPPWVDGIVYLRGQVVPVINLRRRFGLPAVPPDPSHRLVVVSHGERVVALVADSAREFVSIPTDQITAAPDSASQYVDGVANRNNTLILLLNVEKLLDGTNAIRENS